MKTGINNTEQKSKIALVQMTSGADVEKNIEISINYIKEAAKNQAALIAFPECFYFMGPQKMQPEVAETLDGKLVEKFSALAKEHNISILMGSIYEKIENDDRLHNCSILIDNQGKVISSYRKSHLFDLNLEEIVIKESDTIKAGKEIAVIEHEIGKIGLSICYDLRFPQLFQNMTRAGAEIIFIPAAFALQTGKDHWLPLLRARAIENQVYVAAPAQIGRHSSKRISFGSTVLIDPWGTVVSCASEKTGVIYGEIDIEYLNKIRREMPVLQHQVEGIDY